MNPLQASPFIDTPWTVEGAAPAPAPVYPAGVQPLHWFDPTKPETVWQDLAGTIPAVDGEFVMRMDNLGSDGTAILNPQTNSRPDYRTGVLNGKNVIGLSVQQFGTKLEIQPAAGHAVSTLGMSMAVVFKAAASMDGAQIRLVRWSGHEMRISGADVLQGWIPGDANISMGSPTPSNWYMAYWTVGVDDDEDYHYMSPGPEVNVPRANSADIPASFPMVWSMLNNILLGVDVETTDFIIWPRALTAPERAQFRAEITTKYGIA